MVVLAWAVVLTVLTSVLVAWTPGDWVQWAPFAAAAGAIWLFGLFLAIRRVRARAWVLPAFSPATVVLVLGLSALLAGPSFGLWLVSVGAGLAVIGVGAL